jgi:hypothetical protein
MTRQMAASYEKLYRGGSEPSKLSSGNIFSRREFSPPISALTAQGLKRMTAFQNKENVMKNPDQANNNKSLNDPTVANDPQSQVKFDDLPISGEQEERVKGGIANVLNGADGAPLRGTGAGSEVHFYTIKLTNANV